MCPFHSHVNVTYISIICATKLLAYKFILPDFRVAYIIPSTILSLNKQHAKNIPNK